MHECPECGQACDCDGEDTWVGWPANLDCTHDCEDEWGDDQDNNDWDDDYLDDYSYLAPTFMQRVTAFIQRLTPRRCDWCKKWYIGGRYDPCCSEKCRNDWVPF